jgi:transposase
VLSVSDDDVVHQLHLSMPTVKRYKALIKCGGLDALPELCEGGRASSLDQATREWIASTLRGSATIYGFDSDAWTNARLRSLIEGTIAIRFSRVYVWQIATNLGLGHQLSKLRE